MTHGLPGWKDVHLRSLDSIVLALTKASTDYSLLFRGQEDAQWHNLQPSIHRLLSAKRSIREKVLWEGAVINSFRRQARAHIPVQQLGYLDSILGTLTLMQHYGAPTRLLDWTFSPWIAAYFAAAKASDTDGAIWMFAHNMLTQKNYSLDPLANSQGQSAKLRVFEELTSARTIRDWADAAVRESSVFRSFIYEFADARISAQRSVFTIAGTIGADHATRITQMLPDNLSTRRIIIPAEIKEDLMHHLWQMNIGAHTLFPGMDGVGRWIHDAMRVHLPRHDEGKAWVLRETDDGRDVFGEPSPQATSPT